MAKQRSGTPFDDSNPEKTASDGWPAWMGAADPALAPKQPPPPKPKAAAKPPPAAAVPRKAAPAQARAPVQAPSPSAPAPVAKSRPRLGLRAGLWAVVLLWAFVGGVVAARYQPDAAVRLQHAAAAAQLRLGSLLPPAAVTATAVGIPLLLFGALVWQSGRPRRPRFLAFAAFVCLTTASIGMIRGGEGVDMERSAAAFASRIHGLRQELDAWKKSATRGTQALSALESKLQAAESERAKSSMSLPEQDQVLTALRKEIDDLKKKLAAKD